jgi:hypothetical protein
VSSCRTLSIMTEYRAYILGLDGHIVRAVELVCADEELAREQAKRLATSWDVELWQGERQIDTMRKVLRCN